MQRGEGGEHGTDGGAGGHAVDDEGDAGGNDDADGTGGSADGGAEALVIALVLHGGDHECALGGGGGDGGAGDGGKEHTGDGGDHAQAAGDEAHERVEEVQDTLGDAARSIWKKQTQGRNKAE